MYMYMYITYTCIHAHVYGKEGKTKIHTQESFLKKTALGGMAGDLIHVYIHVHVHCIYTHTQENVSATNCGPILSSWQSRVPT